MYSSIEGLDVTTDLANGNCFTGRIATTAVSGVNPNGTPVEDPDGDGFTTSLEECINDALVGFCTTVGGDDTGVISLTPGATSGKKNNKQDFTVTFNNVSGCAVTECSDHVDNEAIGDGLIDFPNDPECSDYNDNNESA